VFKNREMSRLNREVDVGGLAPEDFAQGAFDREQLRVLFNQLEFRTLLPRILDAVGDVAEAAPPNETLDVDVLVARDEKAAVTALGAAAKSACVPTAYTGFLATRSGIERKRDAFMAMTRAIQHMQQWLAEHSAEELAAVTAPFYPDVAPDILSTALQRYRDAGIWGRTTTVSRSGFARLAESLLSGGFISHRPLYEDCVDVSLG
jgi:hypothetical protein